jgi:epoxyqueuosine reductase
MGKCRLIQLKRKGSEGGMDLERNIEEFLMERGALKVGFATLETLAGGPPSADLTYVMPEARSAVSFALPLDRDKIRAYLSKRDHGAHEKDNIEMNIRSSRLAKELAIWLEEQGYASRRVHSNLVYRQEEPGWELLMHPDLSHRYVALRSGVGSLGWSGSVGMKGYGTAILLGTTVTEAELVPTDPVPPEESFCDNCKLCVSACASGLIEPKKETRVTLGGVEFTCSAKRNYMYCQFVCGGFTGLHKSGKWSTWSPGRYRIPDDEGELFATLARAVASYQRWPERKDDEGGYINPALTETTVRLTCGNCQVICWGDKEATKENYRLLASSGCVLQREDGSVEAMPPVEAESAFESMREEHRELYR